MNIENEKMMARKTRAELANRRGDKFIPIFNDDGPKSIMSGFD